MALTVVIRSGELSAPASITFDGPRIVIGRGEGCEVRLPDSSVSHRHASIRQRGTDYVLVDEGSTNGTFAGLVRLSPQAPRVVRSGDLIRVGRIWLELRIEQVPPTQNPQASTRELALSLVASALAAEGGKAHASVRVESGPDAGKELSLSEFERVYVLGRAPNADLPLSDPDASRRHVELFRRGQYVCVRDLGSKNGSELGGQRLAPNKEVPWSPGAKLHFGGNVFDLTDPVLEALGEIEAAQDERLRPDDAIEPPVSPEATAGAEAELAASVARVPPAERGGAAITDVPRNGSLGPAPRRVGGFRLADLLIALFALLVLGLSGVGLVWLLR